jgi:tetratricopeptide (TPR) repeat protein
LLVARLVLKKVRTAALVAAFSMNAPWANEALDQAFRFASAIRGDASDRSSAQERVVLEYATAGHLDAAVALADRIEGWERGVAYAEIAALLVKAGRADEARVMIRKAEDFRAGVSGWQNPRIAAHVGNALAALGAVEPSEAIAKDLASDRQYGGRGPATVAAAYATAGDFEKSMAALASTENLKDPEDGIWRTQGYLASARQPRFSRAERLEALSAARRSAEAIPGWLKTESLVEVAGTYRALGESRTARAVLEKAEAEASAVPTTAPLSAPLLAEVAREWARSAKTERARGLLSRAEAIARSTPDVGRPYILANVAAGYGVLGDFPAARRVLDLALSEAGSQVNARPRALSVVEICRTIARFGLPLDDVARARLDEIYAGLKDPW